MTDPASYEPETTPAGAPKPAGKHKGFRLTPKQAFGGLAAVLLLILIALILYLLWYLSQAGVERGGPVTSGIKPLFMINGPGRGPNPRFSRPMGVAIGLKGRIYVSDTGNNRVCVFDKRGRFLFEFGGFGVAKPLPGGKRSWSPGKLNFPVGIDAAEDGKVYVADFRNDQVQVFDADGRYLRSFPDNMKPTGKGSSGQEGGGIAVTDVNVVGDRVYATDAYQVFVFTTEGKVIRQFGKPGKGAADLDHPNGVVAAPDGTVYVSDSNNNRVSAFDNEGKPLWQASKISASVTGREEGALGLPRGLTLLDDGRVLIADAFNFEIASISPEGKVLAEYGLRGVEAGQFNFPNDIDSLGRNLVLADKENDRVQVVQLVER